MNFSQNFVAIPSMGGILSELLSAKAHAQSVRVSESLESEYLRDSWAPWLVVDLPDGQAAVTVKEAQEMGLQEAAWQ